MYSNSLPFLCQSKRPCGGALLFCLFLSVGARAAVLPTPSPGFNIASISSQTLSALSAWNFTGSMSLNWRNVGPRKPGFETQIQDELYLADIYLGMYGPAFKYVPFWMEFQIPTG